MNEQIRVSLADLRNLGLYGGATAHLDDGTKVTLRRQYCTETRQGYIEGQIKDVEYIFQYAKIYPKIRTIKRDNVLIARKSNETKGVLCFVK